MRVIAFNTLRGQFVPEVLVVEMAGMYAVYRRALLIASGSDRSSVELDALQIVQGRHLRLLPPVDRTVTNESP